MRNGSLWQHSRHFLNLRPAYAFGQWVLENLPLPVGYGITRTAIELAYLASRGLRKGIEANLRQVLSHTQPGRSAREIELEAVRLSHRIFVNRAVWFTDLSVLAGNRQMDGLFRFDMEGNWPALTKALSTGRGVILASAHLGNWHGGGVAVARHGVPVRAVMYRNHAGDFFDRKVARRGNVRQTFVDPDPWAMMEIVRALRQGEVVAMLVDKPWDSRAVEVPFFGRPARFPLGPVRIARLAQVPLFPAFCLGDRPRRYRAVLCDPIEVSGPDPEEAERGALARLTRVIEEFVAANLPIWFNFTPIWD